METNKDRMKESSSMTKKEIRWDKKRKGLCGHFKIVLKMIFILFILLFPVILYINKFHGPLSNDSSDWANFGSYIGGVYSVVLTIVLVYVTHLLNARSEKDSKRREVINKIYEKIEGITADDVYDINKVNELVMKINTARIHINDVYFDELIRFTDYLKNVIHDPSKKNEITVENIKRKLMYYYNE